MGLLTERLLNAQYHNHEEGCCCGECGCENEHNHEEIVEKSLSESEIEEIINEKYSEKDEKTKEFIRKGLRKFGDRFDYSKTLYTKALEKVTITCRKHNTDFEQQAKLHISSVRSYNPCPKCKAEGFSLSLDEFVRRARLVHGDKYGYSEVEYKNLYTKVKIYCIKCMTYFYQNPSDHLRGEGCPVCGREKTLQSIKLSFDDFIKKAKEVHGDKYDYSKSNDGYKDTRSRIIITCKEHGDFTQLVNTHLSGHGCPRCGYDNAAEKCKTSISDFISRANEVHGLGKYDYSRITELNKLTDKIIIHCNVCDRDFEQTAVDHLRGSGCTKCKLSSGEQLVSMYLINKGIDISGYTRLFDVSSVRLYVVPDFLFSLNNNKYWIEYHGEQHYKYLPWFHNTVDKFNDQVHRDLEVKEYCKINNIKLIEIPFTLNTYSKISEFLDKVLYEGIDPCTIINYSSLYSLENHHKDNST